MFLPILSVLFIVVMKAVYFCIHWPYCESYKNRCDLFPDQTLYKATNLALVFLYFLLQYL